MEYVSADLVEHGQRAAVLSAKEYLGAMASLQAPGLASPARGRRSPSCLPNVERARMHDTLRQLRNLGQLISIGSFREPTEPEEG